MQASKAIVANCRPFLYPAIRPGGRTFPRSSFGDQDANHGHCHQDQCDHSGHDDNCTCDDHHKYDQRLQSPDYSYYSAKTLVYDR